MFIHYWFRVFRLLKFTYIPHADVWLLMANYITRVVMFYTTRNYHPDMSRLGLRLLLRESFVAYTY